ncbi:hypothetical protein FDP41_010149 [Naegleria fowleri]|uniref:Thioredoxin domain-containing protein n=2 Tax=Naegleria fowleri TaxID=5763 RepID=A0A6A5ASA0_NAEFO|nr:uncharacterized protein FDP41_010149 [Naegleria fowleri]KAF0971543.1 hypothetical protein FDP41_010149 [Naegleria fowleri]CAG4719621.1 unnamed protein product [Naegleria fowleri]
MSSKLSSLIVSKKFLFVSVGVIVLIYLVSWMNFRAKLSSSVPSSSLEVSSSSSAGKLEMINSDNERVTSSSLTTTTTTTTTTTKEQHDETPSSTTLPTSFIYDDNLKGSSIESFISSPVSLIYIYAPWCGHCKAFAPTFAKLVDKIKEQFGGRIKVARVNGPDNYESAVVKLGVRGYPTLAFFRNGEMKTKLFYEGKRNVEDIVKFIEEKMFVEKSVSAVN